ncbi:hypothetical protein ABE545_10590 [Sphingobacterium faecium]|uniref:hypothetical protein n=1 Tax=Sphingobacterium faecium TaxID=34087 RepID=UPI00320A8888
MKIVLPFAEVCQAIQEAKQYSIEVQGFFLKYNVKINEISIDFEPREGFKFNPSDVFALAWYVKECM